MGASRSALKCLASRVDASKQSYWHTEADTPDKCSPESLQKVGRVLLHWLQTKQ